MFFYSQRQRVGCLFVVLDSKDLISRIDSQKKLKDYKEVFVWGSSITGFAKNKGMDKKNDKDENYLIVILAWNFAREIKEKINKNKGNKKVVVIEQYFPELILYNMF